MKTLQAVQKEDGMITGEGKGRPLLWVHILNCCVLISAGILIEIDYCLNGMNACHMYTVL